MGSDGESLRDTAGMGWWWWWWWWGGGIPRNEFRATDGGEE